MVVQLQYVSGCGERTIKVQQKESKAYIWLKYGKSTVKYGKSTVLYGNFFLVPTVATPTTDLQYEQSSLALCVKWVV